MEGNAITVKIGAETDGIEQSLKKVQASLGRLESSTSQASKVFDISFGKMAGAVATGQAAFELFKNAASSAFSFVADGAKQAIELGGRLTDLSTRTGESAGNLLVLERAFQNTGVGADKVGPTINKLQKNIEEASVAGSEQAQTFEALGLKYKDIAGKTPTQQMEILAQKISAISDPGQQAAATMAVFGKSGGELLPVLKNFSDETAQAKGQLGSLPGVMDRSMKAFDDLGDSLGAIGTKVMEFGAGFLENALPALNAFASAVAGIDAAGWGEKMMQMVFRVADTLLGAFKSPQTAIEALFSIFNASIRDFGNKFLNIFIGAGDFVSKLFSSEIPGIVVSVLGNTLIKTFIDAAKALIDALNSVIKAFETWLGAAISNVVDFFTTKFSGVLNAVAKDFQSAMSDPIGFVTGKLDSALKGVMDNGGTAFKTSFEKAGGSTLDKLSSGLGAVSDQYGQKIQAGTEKIGAGLKKIVSEFTPAATDFFGAKKATEEMNKKFGELEAKGKETREHFMAGKNAMAESANHSATISNNGASFLKNITESAKWMQKIAKAREEQAIDPGGRLGKQVDDSISKAKKADNQATADREFANAERAARRAASNEKDNAIRGIGANRDSRAISEIGRDFGLSPSVGETDSQFRDRVLAAKNAAKKGVPVDQPSLKDRMADASKDFRDRFKKPDAAADAPKSLKDRMAEATKDFRDRFDKKPDALKPTGQQGQKDPSSEKSGGKATLDTLVADIKKLLEKIEPRLPVAALV